MVGDITKVETFDGTDTMQTRGLVAKVGIEDNSERTLRRNLEKVCSVLPFDKQFVEMEGSSKRKAMPEQPHQSKLMDADRTQDNLASSGPGVRSQCAFEKNTTTAIATHKWKVW
jgi:hypothetical protein